MIKIHDWLSVATPQSPFQAASVRWYRGLCSFTSSPTASFGMIIITMLVVIAAVAPILPLASPIAQDLSARLQPPGLEHLFGTDELGRDILSRVAFGARITLTIVAMVSVIVMPIGLAVGTIAGYFGGATETILMRVTDVFMAFPKLILALAFVAVLGPGIENAVIAIALTSWPAYARVARAQTLSIRNVPYIKAVELQGASNLHILRHHIVPVCTSFLIVQLTLDMSGIILTAAGLGFLGLGAQPPSPEWGAMTAAGRQYLFTHWWVATIPGMMILLVSLGFNLLGDGLRDVLDPKQQ